MMKRILIFCEGITDQVFIADWLEKNFSFSTSRESRKDSKNKKLKITFGNDNFKGEIIDVGGCDRLRRNELFHTEMQDNTKEGGINIVVFDADYTNQDNGNKGINACKQKLNSIKTDKKIDFNYYVWPDDKSDGEIETLLRKLVPQDKEVVFECIDKHQECLKATNIENLRVADLKTKIGYYLYTAKQQSEGRNRDYKNSDFWNMDTENTFLKHFIDFLRQNIQT